MEYVLTLSLTTGFPPKRFRRCTAASILRRSPRRPPVRTSLPDSKLDPNEPIVTTLANIRPVKGIDIFIRAAARVCRELPLAKFLVIGDVLVPATYAELRSMVDSLGLNENVHFLWAVCRIHIPLLAASNVFCLPSRSEGFSNALLEAMGSGLPCVCDSGRRQLFALSRVVWIGYLVESEDAEGMGEIRILELLRLILPECAPYRQPLGKQRRGALQHLLWSEAHLTTIYDELLAAFEVNA